MNFHSSPVKMVTPTYNVRDLLLIGMGPNEEYPYIIVSACNSDIVSQRDCVHVAVHCVIVIIW